MDRDDDEHISVLSLSNSRLAYGVEKHIGASNKVFHPPYPKELDSWKLINSCAFYF